MKYEWNINRMCVYRLYYIDDRLLENIIVLICQLKSAVYLLFSLFIEPVLRMVKMWLRLSLFRLFVRIFNDIDRYEQTPPYLLLIFSLPSPYLKVFLGWFFCQNLCHFLSRSFQIGYILSVDYFWERSERLESKVSIFNHGHMRLLWRIFCYAIANL